MSFYCTVSVDSFVCLFTSYASHLSFFLTFFLTCLLPYLSFPSRIHQLRFEARGRKSRPNLGFLVVLVYFMLSYFCVSDAWLCSVSLAGLLLQSYTCIWLREPTSCILSSMKDESAPVSHWCIFFTAFIPPNCHALYLKRTGHQVPQVHNGVNMWPLGGQDPLPLPKKIGRTTPTFWMKSDDRYIADCSPRNWVYYPYFVLYNNLDQGIGPPTLKTWLRPCIWATHVPPV